jgi:hypothetical protein
MAAPGNPGTMCRWAAVPFDNQRTQGGAASNVVIIILLDALSTIFEGWYGVILRNREIKR